MAVITGYTSLVTAVQDWLVRSDMAVFAPNFIQNWEEDFYREPKNFGNWMEDDLSVVIASSVAACPTDYLGLKYAYVNGSPSTRLERMGLNQTLGRYPRGGYTGCPGVISRIGTNFIFGPEPDSTYTINGVYWAKPTALRSYAGDAAAHWLILNAPDLPLYGALLHSAPFLKNDSRLPVWEAIYTKQLQSYRRLWKEEEVSGSPSMEVLA